MAAGILNAWVEAEADHTTPVIWQYEVGNFLDREMPEVATEKMVLLRDLKMRSVNLNANMFRKCIKWMEKYKVTFYHACYLAVGL